MANLQSYNQSSTGNTQFEMEHGVDTNQEPTNEEATESDTDDGSYQVKTEVNNYNLVRDRQMRVIRPPDRYGHADLVHFALTAASD